MCKHDRNKAKEVQLKNSNKKHLRCQEVEVLLIFCRNKGLISCCRTQRSKFFDSLPFLVDTGVFSKHGGDDVDELISSSDSLASSPSRFSSASGASDTDEARSAGRGPASRKGGCKTLNW
jgi:hypothetical protein